MKRIKDRPMTPLLAKQLKIQKKRITDAGIDAMLGKMIITTNGTFYSQRFVIKEEVL